MPENIYLSVGPELETKTVTRTVLVSITGEKLFRTTPLPDIEPLFYHYRDEKLTHKVLRKLSVRGPRDTLNDKLELMGDDASLQEVSALWLSSPVYLEPAVMNCLLDLLPKLEWVYSQATGYEHLDLAAFRAQGVKVSNSGQLVSLPVAELALACILNHAKRLFGHQELQRRRRWHSLRSDLLCDLTIGIVGTGHIGGELAHLCGALGMRVLGASRNPARFQPGPSPYHQVLELEEGLPVLLTESDHVVLTVPLTEATREMIGARELASMKRNAVLINVSRGPVVDQTALCDALSRGEIGAAYIDRTENLPPPRWSRLYRTPNLHLTHYSAANTPGVQRSACKEFLKGLRALDAGTEPANRVA